MNQPIIQPGQILFDFAHHLPPEYTPAQPHTVQLQTPDGRVILQTFGGLTVREEIASRILAGLLGSEVMVKAVSFVPNDSKQKDIMVNTALAFTDMLLAKTRAKVETE